MRKLSERRAIERTEKQVRKEPRKLSMEEAIARTMERFHIGRDAARKMLLSRINDGSLPAYVDCADGHIRKVVSLENEHDGWMTDLKH